MQIELAKLLRERAIEHPSRLVSAGFDGRDLRLVAAGWPWWNEKADRGRDHQIEFLFQGVSNGNISLADFHPQLDEALEEFSITTNDMVSWAASEWSDIYCYGPLLTPMNTYAAVHDFLVSEGAHEQASDYLNCPDNRLGAFLEIVQKSSYLLGRFPAALGNVVRAQLDAQRVPYSELPWARPNTYERLLVTIAGSQFWCEQAIAFFEG